MYKSIFLIASFAVATFASPAFFGNVLKTGASCAANEVAVGIVCANNCNSVALTCTQPKNVIKTDGQITVLNSACYTHTVFSGLTSSLAPTCREIGVSKKVGQSTMVQRMNFDRNCETRSAGFSSGVGINCKANQLISKVNVDKVSKKIVVKCCQPNDLVPV